MNGAAVIGAPRRAQRSSNEVLEAPQYASQMSFFSKDKEAGMSRAIPEIRARLHQLAVEHGIPELAQLAEETKRQYHGRRASPRARPVDKAVAARVQRFARMNPNMPQREIGRRFRIDGGRVSEILFGKRGESEA